MFATSDQAPLDSSTETCALCNSFQYGSGKYAPFDEWVLEIRNSSCQYCKMLVDAIQRLYPGFLLGECREQTSGSRPGVEARILVGERCRVSVSISEDGWGHLEVDIQFFRPLSHEAQGIEQDADKRFIACGEISRISGDVHMWRFLRQSLQHCLNEHPKCAEKQNPDWVPERLLRLILDDQGETALQLVETKKHQPTSRYIALSHCWGSKPVLRTTVENIDNHLHQIPLWCLPRTFQDCVAVARELLVSYIWIDSLCIVQDIRADWAQHAQLMDRIYENSLFTVAAVSSMDSSVPFLGPDAPTSREQWEAIDATNDLSNIRARKTSAFLLPSFILGPLEDRAWAWQERYCSVRTINFTEEEARWVCASGKTCECVGTMQPNVNKLRPHADFQSLRDWHNAVSDYSARELTFNTDRLPAFAGAASRFHASIRSTYVAGIWEKDLPRGLAWYRGELDDCPDGKPTVLRALDNGVPSWSWASVPGQVHLLWRRSLSKKRTDEDGIPWRSEVEIVSFSSSPSTDNVYGEVEVGSYIELHGRVVEAFMESDIHGCACVRKEGFGPQLVIPDCLVILDPAYSLPEQDNQGLPPQSQRHSYGQMRRAIPTDVLPQAVDEGARSIGQIYCLLLFTATRDEQTHACVLILGKLPGSENTYQRLGLGCTYADDWTKPLYRIRKSWDIWEAWEELEEWKVWQEWFKGATEQTIRIV